MNIIIPTIFCRIFGHKWILKYKRFNDPTMGYIQHYQQQYKACTRCGEPNPNYRKE